MGSITRSITIILLVTAVLIALYAASRAIASLQQGYSWSEMDWNEQGRTSIQDFSRAADIGRRTINKNGSNCVDYYSYKDGLSVKVTCPVERK
jgi:hypothetical protein